jgi:acetyl esterase/lipase
MGFSAGGHLASSLATARDAIDETSSDTLHRFSSAPDFTILIYPVISLHAPEAHVGSANNLLGPEATDEQRMEMSTELRVTDRTSPTFLLTAMDDLAVPAQNSIAYHAALQRCGVPAELHLLPAGGHGFGMKDPQLNEQWLTRLKWWLEKRDLL